MGILFEFFSSIATILFSFTKDVTEEEIEKNITFLKEYKWFQKYFNDAKYEKLIKEDPDVRYIIGKFNIEKMKNKTSYYNKYQKKIQKALLKYSN